MRKRVTMHLPYEDVSEGIVARDVIVDSKKGNDETGDGSFDRPLRTKRGIKKLIRRMTDAREKTEFEAKHKAEREAAEKEAADRYAKQTEERAKREAERKAKQKELDEKIARCEVELTSLKKTYLETMHLFEIAQLDLMAGEDAKNWLLPGNVSLPSMFDRLNKARAFATQLHHLRMVIMERSAEHDMLTEQSGGSENLWSGLGWAAAVSLAGLWAYQLFGMEKK